MKNQLVALFLTLILSASAAWSAEPKRIYLAEDDHTDFMWTADADTYERVFVEMLDHHLRVADETAANAPSYRHRFNCDGSYWLWAYQQRKSPAEFARLISRIKDGTISVPMNSLVSCYGGQPVEAVLRGMYYAGRLERQHGLKFDMAIAMENQTLPLGLASLFAGSGARYSWRGVCACATRMDKKALGEREHEIYWWTGKDGQRLLLKWYSHDGDIGGYFEATDPVAAIEHVDRDPDFLARYVDPKTRAPYRVAGVFGFGGDDLARKSGVKPPPEVPGVPGLHKLVSSPYRDPFHRIAQQMSDESRQVIVSNERDFFADFEKTHGESLPSKAVTYGNEWDLYSASMSETSARAKRAVEKLRSAELLAALVSLKHPSFMQRHSAARDRAFHAIGLFWEHNWTADGPISRPQRAAWQELLVTQIESYVESIFGESVIRLGGMIPRPDKAKRFFVLNPLGRSRTQHADFAYLGSADVHVRDATTGKDVPHQLVRLHGTRHLRILASDVPSAGYKVYEIVPGKGSATTDDAAAVSGNILENEALKLFIERDGAISSLVDKRHGNTELAATIGGLRLNDFTADSDAGEPLRIVNRGPVSVTVRARSEAGLAHTTDITLYRASDRVDIENELNENFGDVRHWAFSLALNEPSVHTEEVGAVILDKPQSQGGDYANTHARYDYLSVNHFADISAGRRGITLSNPDLAFARLGNSTTSTLDTATPQLSFLAGGQVDGPGLGIPAQNGQHHFLQRFALRPHGGYSQTAAMKFALEHQNPFVTAPIISNDNGDAYPEKQHSLLSISDPNVLLWALKIHDDGIEHGLVTRLWNQSDEPAQVRITLTPQVKSAQRITHLETKLEDLPVVKGSIGITIGARRLESLGVKPSP
ncbi:MAG: glycoside hydrolase [Limisphaerales bacterium]